MRFTKHCQETKKYVKLYKNKTLSIGAALKGKVGNADHLYIDWIGKKIIFTPTNNNDDCAFKIHKVRGNMSIRCRGIVPLIPVNTSMEVTINEDGSFWIPALEEAEE